jgi:serpin B
MTHFNQTNWIAGFLLLFTVALTAGADPAADQAKLVAANSGFAFELMGQLAQAQPGANVFISPYSVSSALQRVDNGAAGGTKAEIQQVLKTSDLADPSLKAACQSLDRQLAGHRDVTLNLANGLWVQQGYHLKPAFYDYNRTFFRAGFGQVDFGQPQAAQTINDWADQQTRGKIKDVVQFPFPPLTRLVLANAIYFKGKWSVPFKKDQTQPRYFHLANGQSKLTPMMMQAGHFQYQETTDFQAVKLPYRGGLQMELYLPQTNSNPQTLLGEFMAGQTWEKDIQSGFARREGSVTLPKFKIEYQVDLNGPLQSLGMKSAFDIHADFSGIADEPLSISEVKQKSFVDVNEEGTEAAAVTTMNMSAQFLMMPENNPFVLVLDRPFFFVISDMNTGSILFMGVVNNPIPGE